MSWFSSAPCAPRIPPRCTTLEKEKRDEGQDFSLTRRGKRGPRQQQDHQSEIAQEREDRERFGCDHGVWRSGPAFSLVVFYFLAYLHAYFFAARERMKATNPFTSSGFSVFA